MNNPEKKPFDPVQFEKDWAAEGVASKAWAAEVGLTVAKIKTFAAGSEETLCFVADLMVNGKKVGTAENDGHGGCTFLRTCPGVTDADREVIRHALAERFVDDFVNQWEDDKAFNRALSRLRTKARKVGARTFGYLINRESGEIAAVWSGNPDTAALSAKNPTYTVEVL